MTPEARDAVLTDIADRVQSLLVEAEKYESGRTFLDLFMQETDALRSQCEALKSALPSSAQPEPLITGPFHPDGCQSNYVDPRTGRTYPCTCQQVPAAPAARREGTEP